MILLSIETFLLMILVSIETLLFLLLFRCICLIIVKKNSCFVFGI